MSQAVSATLKRRTGGHFDDSVEPDLDELLAVLEDADCRAVLEATGEEALSAKEIGERCDIPSSTVYRKIERLTEAGLLEEGLRIRTSGKHTNEYSRRVDHIALTIGNTGTELQVESRAAGETPQAAD